MSLARALVEAEDPKDFLKRVASRGFRVRAIPDSRYMVEVTFGGEPQHNLLIESGNQEAQAFEDYLNWLNQRFPYTEFHRQSWIPDGYLRQAGKRWPGLYMRETGKPAFMRLTKTSVVKVYAEDTPDWLDMDESAEDPKKAFKRLPRCQWVIKAETTNGRVFKRCFGSGNDWHPNISKNGTLFFSTPEEALAVIQRTHAPAIIARHQIQPFELTHENIAAENIYFDESVEDPKRFLQRYGRDFVYTTDYTVYYVTPLTDKAEAFLAKLPDRLPCQSLKSDGSVVVQPRYWQQFLALAGDELLIGRWVNEMAEEDDEQPEPHALPVPEQPGPAAQDGGHVAEPGGVSEAEDPKRVLRSVAAERSPEVLQKYGFELRTNANGHPSWVCQRGDLFYAVRFKGEGSASGYVLSTWLVSRHEMLSSTSYSNWPELMDRLVSELGPLHEAEDPRRVLKGELGEKRQESQADAIAKEAAKAEEPKSAEHAEAGNYRKGHIRLHGWEIAIENAKGAFRKSKDPKNPWQVKMPCHYGYIKGTVGKDKDHLDVFIGENPSSILAFVVNQVKKDGGAFDEHKIMLGFKSKDEAVAAYDKSFTGDLGPKLRKSVVSCTVDQVKQWIEKGDVKREFAVLKEAEDPKGVFKRLPPPRWSYGVEPLGNSMCVYIKHAGVVVNHYDIAPSERGEDPDELGKYWVDWYTKLDKVCPYRPEEWSKIGAPYGFSDWYEKAYSLIQKRMMGEAEDPKRRNESEDPKRTFKALPRSKEWQVRFADVPVGQRFYTSTGGTFTKISHNQARHERPGGKRSPVNKVITLTDLNAIVLLREGAVAESPKAVFQRLLGHDFVIYRQGADDARPVYLAIERGAPAGYRWVSDLAQATKLPPAAAKSYLNKFFPGYERHAQHVHAGSAADIQRRSFGEGKEEAAPNQEAFDAAMRQATGELIANERAQVFGGGREDARRIGDGYDINCGMCEEWGERVAQLYRNATGRNDVEVLDPGNLTGNPDDSLAGHTFLRFGGKFYDAECPEGVAEFRQLPLFSRQESLGARAEASDARSVIDSLTEAEDPKHFLKRVAPRAPWADSYVRVTVTFADGSRAVRECPIVWVRARVLKGDSKWYAGIDLVEKAPTFPRLDNTTLVFVLAGIEYAIMEGPSETRGERRYEDGENGDVEASLRSVKWEYVGNYEQDQLDATASLGGPSDYGE